MRIHTGEKPYKCTFNGCTSTFKAYGHLKDHSKIHLNFKPFCCTLCDAKYARASTLKIHMRTHTHEKPYLCPQENCGKKFIEKGNMKTHYKRHFSKNKNSEKIVLSLFDNFSSSSKDDSLCSQIKTDASLKKCSSSLEFIFSNINEFSDHLTLKQNDELYFNNDYILKQQILAPPCIQDSGLEEGYFYSNGNNNNIFL